jgi:hypothetical protein
MNKQPDLDIAHNLGYLSSLLSHAKEAVCNEDYDAALYHIDKAQAARKAASDAMRRLPPVERTTT